MGLLIIEIVFGSWFNSKNGLGRLNLIIDEKLTYKVDGLYESENDLIKYSRDKHGIRGKYDDIKDINILTIGGSTTDQRYITDDLTWQQVMQNSFAAEGKNIIVANAGVDGQSTFGHIVNFNVWFSNIPNLNPQYFLFYIGINDFYKNPSFDSHYDTLEKPKGRWYQEVKKAIKSKSILYFLYDLSRNIQGAQSAGVGHRKSDYNELTYIDSEPLIKNHDEHIKDRLLAYQNRVELLCRKVQNIGAIPIFVTQSERRLYKFVNGQLYGESSYNRKYDGLIINAIDYYHMIRLFNNVTKKVAKQNDAIFIDLNSELEFDLEKDFYDSNHNTPSGAKKVGKYLFKKLNRFF